MPSGLVIVVPKYDELVAIEWAFETVLTVDPNYVTPSGVRIYRRRLNERDISFAFMDAQNTTNAAVATMDVLHIENPQHAFLVGTALGRTPTSPLGSVLVVVGDVLELIEHQVDADGTRYRGHNTIRPSYLSHKARNFAENHFRQKDLYQTIRAAFRQHRDLPNDGANGFLKANNPKVLHESLASGNDYFMTAQPSSGSQPVERMLWGIYPTVKGYDMESAGFARAAEARGVPWLVVRGISDYGTGESKNDHNRAVAASVAGRFLWLFVQNELPRTSSPIDSVLESEAFRLDGRWKGLWVYADDEGKPVVMEDECEFTHSDVRSAQGNVKTRRLVGSFPFATTEYTVEFDLQSSGHVGGRWKDSRPSRHYFGVMLAQLRDDSDVLDGSWLGTHKGGVHHGAFRWYNLERNGVPTSRPEPDWGLVRAELLAEAYNDDERAS